MSKTIEQQGYIVWRKYSYEDKPNYVFLDYKPSGSHESVMVMPYTLKFELPADFDPTGQQIAALEAMKAEASQKFQETVAKINLEISKLQAITFEQN
jgi:hypothetical protein